MSMEAFVSAVQSHMQAQATQSFQFYTYMATHGSRFLASYAQSLESLESVRIEAESLRARLSEAAAKVVSAATAACAAEARAEEKVQDLEKAQSLLAESEATVAELRQAAVVREERAHSDIQRLRREITQAQGRANQMEQAMKESVLLFKRQGVIDFLPSPSFLRIRSTIAGQGLVDGYDRAVDQFEHKGWFNSEFPADLDTTAQIALDGKCRPAEEWSPLEGANMSKDEELLKRSDICPFKEFADMDVNRLAEVLPALQQDVSSGLTPPSLEEMIQMGLGNVAAGFEQSVLQGPLPKRPREDEVVSPSGDPKRARGDAGEGCSYPAGDRENSSPGL